MTLSSQSPSAEQLAPWKTSNELVLLTGASGEVLEVNPAFARKVGLPQEECLGSSAGIWCAPDEQRGFLTRLQAMGTSTSFDQRWRTHQGWRWIEWEATRVNQGIRLVGRDVSARRLAEGHLGRLSQAVEQAPLGILITSPTGKVQYMNQGYTEYSGFTLEDALEPDFSLLKEGHPSEAAYRHFCASVAAGTAWQGTLQCPTKDGRLIWERVLVSPALDGKGEISHLLCIRENLTSQREVEEKLARTEQRLEEETRAYPGAALSEEAQLTLQGAAQWMDHASSTKATRSALARLARISNEVLPAPPSGDGPALNGATTTSLHLVFHEAITALNRTLPAGRKILYRGTSGPRVSGESWHWMQVVTLAARNFLLGRESRISMRVSTSLLARGRSERQSHRTLRLKISRTASSGARTASDPSNIAPSDLDLAFIAGVVRQAGGRVVSGFEKPWSDPLVLEIPARSS